MKPGQDAKYEFISLMSHVVFQHDLLFFVTNDSELCWLVTKPRAQVNT